MKPTRQLEGKTALITGATRGIGAAIARGFAAEGARVFLHGRDAAAGRALEHETGWRFFGADLADSAQVEELAAAVCRECDRLDILVNNAGVELVMPFSELDLAKLDRMWQVNVRAPAQLIHLLLPALKASGSASVINVTSIHETVPYPHNAGYSLTKAALGMLTRTIAIELAPFGIRVNNFAPGAVETDINREVVEKMRVEFAEWIPAGRVAQVEEMIGPAVFLASDASGYVTGATLVADGAYSHNLVRYRP
jgi:short-subunit dehydrogenase